MKIDERLKKGLALFYEEKYFECHDVLEGLWKETNDSYKDLYKGIIHAAVALYLLEQGRLPGAEKRFQSAVYYLEKYKSTALDVDLEKLIEELKQKFRLNK